MCGERAAAARGYSRRRCRASTPPPRPPGCSPSRRALSALAHDLELEVGAWSIDVGDDGAVDARFEPGSLRVLHAVSGGVPTGALGDGDKRKIAATIAGEVLDARRHPELRFRAPAATAAGDGYQLSGELTLHGQTRPLRVTTRRDGEHQVAEVTLHQPDFGITPYKAMLGTLRIKPDVRVVVRVPWPASR
ncbi:MAG: YceI family protein [Kofleriaceae bacterium]